MTIKGLIKLTQLLQEYPLTIIQWQILMVISENPGETITDLVNEEKLTCGTPSDIAVSVKRLGEGRHDRPGLGLIKKSQHEADGRYFKLTLTAKGKKLVEKIKNKSRTMK
ncbi:MarR family winged helix-turn-helix transcriptional regulator [Endozoicomonas euniceicola]|uniref:HTH marR-type domain-containing protein n=1 Tax=Endozoicomonas euniceicola TaxID=1234143 RepID=A0ABY6GSW0_9GAMM|nr:hypothetical protein [Endozoicomonas euniceicola]UYM15847.1 hypothetical protein NX720_23980 [Endozoicomonas euniceicola]